MAAMAFFSWCRCPFEMALIVFQKKLSHIANHSAYSNGDAPYVNWQQGLEHHLLTGFESSLLLNDHLSGSRSS